MPLFLAKKINIFRNSHIIFQNSIDPQLSTTWYLLRIHITFSIAPTKMKISLLLFSFTHRKYIYLKGKINSLSNHGTHKNKNNFWRKQLSNIFMAVEV